MNVYTEAAILSSYRAAVRMAERDGAFVSNRASMAGMLLSQHGSVAKAIANCPGNTGFFGSVRDLLVEIERGSRATTPALRLLQTGVRVSAVNDVTAKGGR